MSDEPQPQPQPENRGPIVSDALVASLNSEIQRLNAAVAKANAESAKRRKDLRAAEDRVAKAEAQLAELTADRDRWKGQAEAAPGDQAKRITDLENQIRFRDHRDAFREALSGQLRDKVTVDKVLAEIGYAPGESVPTAEEIAELVGKARDAAPYLFASEEGETPAPSREGTTQPNGKPLSGPGGGRGGPDTTPGKVRYTVDEIRAPGWEKKRPELSKAFAEGRAERIER